MKQFLNGWSIKDVLGGTVLVIALAYLIWGPGAPDDIHGSSSLTPAVLTISFATLAILVAGLSLLFRAVPVLAYRERRRPDGFEWGRPPVQRLTAVAAVCYFAFLAMQQGDFVQAVWQGRDWPRIAITGLLTAGFVARIGFEITRMVGFPVVLSVTSDGLMAADRTVTWSQVETAVFDRHRWHEFGLVLKGDGGSREWWFSLRDAGIEAPHFLDRLQRAAPQVEVLKPKGEPMAGAHPIPAA